MGTRTEGRDSCRQGFLQVNRERQKKLLLLRDDGTGKAKSLADSGVLGLQYG